MVFEVNFTKDILKRDFQFVNGILNTLTIYVSVRFLTE